MHAILIPVKNLAHAKQRLAPAMTQESRTRLARAMMQDVLAAVAALRNAPPVFVVSSDTGALAAARERGWECLPEEQQSSESDSVDAASRICAARGITGLLRIPIDVPLITAADIEAVLAACPGGPGAVLIPSGSGDGTNALLRTPPHLFPSHFGPGSFARHIAEARRCNAEVRIVRNAHFELDVDDAADLRAVAAAEGLGRHTAEALQQLRVAIGAAG